MESTTLFLMVFVFAGVASLATLLYQLIDECIGVPHVAASGLARVLDSRGLVRAARCVLVFLGGVALPLDIALSKGDVSLLDNLLMVGAVVVFGYLMVRLFAHLRPMVGREPELVDRSSLFPG